MGIINLGGAGSIVVDGTTMTWKPRVFYIRRGSRGILCASDNPAAPAQFYLVSYPAHTDYPTTKAALKDANHIERSLAESNRRTIRSSSVRALSGAVSW